MSTSAARLVGLRSELENRGVVDVKFHFDMEKFSMFSADGIAEKVADFIQCYLDGDGEEVKAIGDVAGSRL